MKKIMIIVLALLLLPLADLAVAQRGGQSGGGGRRGQGSSQQRWQQDAGRGQRGMGQGRQGQGQRGMGQGQRGMGQGQRGMGQGQRGMGQGRGRGQGQQAAVLDANLATGLTQMREEEKLARDVYLTLGEKWNLKIFNNIARAESRHMSAVGNLLRKYNLPDPVVDDTRGQFTNEKYNELYQQLVATGLNSPEDALRVGVKIEEMDIADLKQEIDGVQSQDIRRVYLNLLRGSEQHLRAFNNQLR